MVEVLSESPFIAFMPQWTNGTECAELEQEARAHGLSGAQVFGQRGIVADRRALSANLYWDEKNASAMTNTLIRRAFAFTKEQRGYDIVPGAFQEPLNFIEYDFAGEYRPHCDGVCHKTRYSTGGRVATLIHYCKAATVGGATVFPKTGLKVVEKHRTAQSCSLTTWPRCLLHKNARWPHRRTRRSSSRTRKMTARFSSNTCKIANDAFFR
jgi:hypothetical protein